MGLLGSALYDGRTSLKCRACWHCLVLENFPEWAQQVKVFGQQSHNGSLSVG
ncbi:hypothetical protein O9993_01245 [Vibrio lentus]|nr:hypothetical protein [Vibrio lentus]